MLHLVNIINKIILLFLGLLIYGIKIFLEVVEKALHQLLNSDYLCLEEKGVEAMRISMMYCVSTVPVRLYFFKERF